MRHRDQRDYSLSRLSPFGLLVNGNFRGRNHVRFIFIESLSAAEPVAALASAHRAVPAGPTIRILKQMAVYPAVVRWRKLSRG